MRIPKYVERLIKRRERLAWELIEVSFDLDNWLEKHGISICTDYTATGCMIYCEPSTAANLVRQDILKAGEEATP